MYELKLQTIRSGFNPGQIHCWTHSRAGVVRGDQSEIVLTMSPLNLSGSDIFSALHEMRSKDNGKSWTEPIEQETLGRRQLTGGYEEVICDFTPKWHQTTGKLLGTGQTVTYQGDQIYPPNRKTAYAIYHPETKRWGEWKTISMPAKFLTSGAGSTQRVDLDNGNILLPIYFKNKQENDGISDVYYSTVIRCQFDGETMNYVEQGSDITYPTGRGYYEPSLACFQGEYFLTMRADDHGAVAISEDGLNYSETKRWKWDDGSEVPTYNTQQHWVTHSDALFLVYTRKAGNNDHVFRHRAPLFIAQVDPERLCLIRETEQIIVPEHGARLGNFGVVDLCEGETWVTATEWMQNGGIWGETMMEQLEEKYASEELASIKEAPYMSGLITKFGAENRIFAARILWDKPNRVIQNT